MKRFAAFIIAILYLGHITGTANIMDRTCFCTDSQASSYVITNSSDDDTQCNNHVSNYYVSKAANHLPALAFKGLTIASLNTSRFQPSSVLYTITSDTNTRRISSYYPSSIYIKNCVLRI